MWESVNRNLNTSQTWSMLLPQMSITPPKAQGPLKLFTMTWQCTSFKQTHQQFLTPTVAISTKYISLCVLAQWQVLGHSIWNALGGYYTSNTNTKHNAKWCETQCLLLRTLPLRTFSGLAVNTAHMFNNTCLSFRWRLTNSFPQLSS